MEGGLGVCFGRGILYYTATEAVRGGQSAVCINSLKFAIYPARRVDFRLPLVWVWMEERQHEPETKLQQDCGMQKVVCSTAKASTS